MVRSAPIALAVHGGAWAIPNDAVENHRQGVLNALKAGWAILARGGSAVEAVEQAVMMMEDDETFDAGRGATLNSAGEIELDAAIMNGKTLRAGAVAAVQQVRNPIRLARAIMEKSDLVLLAGMGATRFAREHGIPTCGLDELITRREIERWRAAQAGGGTSRAKPVKWANADTVGAVALDRSGVVASGTSTGGTPNKHPGRIGDAPLVGCGTYADSAVGGVSTSGWGEAMIRVVMAKTVVDLMERNGRDPDAAVRDALKLLEKKADGYGGAIAVSREGKIAARFNTPRMARAYMSSSMKTPFASV